MRKRRRDPGGTPRVSSDGSYGTGASAGDHPVQSRIPGLVSRRRPPGAGSVLRNAAEGRVLVAAIGRPAFDAGSLERHARRRWSVVVAATRRRDLGAIGRPRWDVGLKSIESHFGLTSYHFARYEPATWPKLTETQVTRTLASMLCEGDAALVRSRVDALLVGLSRAACENAQGLRGNGRPRVVAEERRLDILVEDRDLRGRVVGVVVVEAKLGHDVTRTQLPRYHAIACALAGDRGYVRTYVVAPDLSRLNRRIMGRNSGWVPVAWDRLLLRFGQYLARTAGRTARERELGRFLHTVWHRVGSERRWAR